MPVNTHGSSLSEVYLHGFSHALEAVRLVRGTSTRQPKKTINHVLATAAPIAPTSRAWQATWSTFRSRIIDSVCV